MVYTFWTFCLFRHGHIINILKYLDHIARAEPNLQSPIRDVFEKHLSNNAIVNCLHLRNGTFFEYVKQTPRSDEIEASTTSGHVCVPPKVMSLQEFINIETISRQEEDDSFNPLPHLKNFKPSSVDAERLFSLAHLSKNFSQGRMKPDVHERNVFLTKNKPLFQ